MSATILQPVTPDLNVEQQKERLRAAHRQMMAVPGNLKAKDRATLEEMLAIPEPICKRGQEYFITFLPIRKVALLGKAFTHFMANADMMDEEEAADAIGNIGQQFLFKQIGPLELRPATIDEITDWWELDEFVQLIQNYLSRNGFKTGQEVGQAGEQQAQETTKETTENSSAPLPSGTDGTLITSGIE